jgi:transcription-repair coupling factor (superfamily II helicase)
VLIKKFEDLFSQLDKQFDRAEEAFEKLSKDIKHACQINYFKSKDFYKKSLRFFDSGIKR